MGLPTYQCHKKVQAAKIKRVLPVAKIVPTPAPTVVPGLVLELPDGTEEQICVTEDFLSRAKPQAGGYFVLYEDDYQSYSPAAAFENGYTLIEGT